MGPGRLCLTAALVAPVLSGSVKMSYDKNEFMVHFPENQQILNDSDSLELFKKTLPNPSLIQMKTRGAIVRQETVKILKAGNHQKDPRVDLVMLALTGKASSFDKGLKMIDDMVGSAWQ